MTTFIPEVEDERAGAHTPQNAYCLVHTPAGTHPMRVTVPKGFAHTTVHELRERVLLEASATHALPSSVVLFIADTVSAGAQAANTARQSIQVRLLFQGNELLSDTAPLSQYHLREDGCAVQALFSLTAEGQAPPPASPSRGVKPVATATSVTPLPCAPDAVGEQEHRRLLTALLHRTDGASRSTREEHEASAGMYDEESTGPENADAPEVDGPGGEAIMQATWYSLSYGVLLGVLLGPLGVLLVRSPADVLGLLFGFLFLLLYMVPQAIVSLLS